MFRNGQLTSCKPISDADLGRYIADCLVNPALQNRILPIGGAGPAIAPLAQAEALFALLGQTPRVRHVPVRMMDALVAVLQVLATVSPKFRDKAELARIGRYYGTESMLVVNPVTGRYDAEATPETGRETLLGFYASLIAGTAAVKLGEHAVI